jgi:hypothetical protein
MLKKLLVKPLAGLKFILSPPKKKKEFSPEQKEEVLIAKSQPLQS